MDAFERDFSAIDWSLAPENIDTDLSFKTIKTISMRTKKIQETCGKGSKKYSKKTHKTNSQSSLLVENETTTNITQMTEHINQYFTSTGKNL